jgi:hypothetical protein
MTSTTLVQNESVFSVYTRSEFEVGTPGDIVAMTLELKYDDGFITWLNVVEVTSSLNMSVLAPACNTIAATSNHEAVEFEWINDLSPHIDQLVQGTNVLAIGIWNRAQDSTDLFMPPILKLFDGPSTPSISVLHGRAQQAAP